MPSFGARLFVQTKYSWKKKAIAVLDQDPPVQNTWYTLLDTVEDTRIYTLIGRQINDEADNKLVEMRMTIDGIEIAPPKTFVDSTWYFFYQGWQVESLGTITTLHTSNYYNPIEAQSLKVEMRMTSAVGTNQKLDGRIQYGTLEAT